MPLPPFGWQNVPSTATPLSAQELELFAQYLASYAESLGSGSGSGTPAIPFGGTNRSALVTDSGATGTGGVRWSRLAAPYNICENTGSTTGADPSGAVDATGAITAKLNEAAGKGPVFAPPGVYNIATLNGVNVPSDTYLYGVPGQTVFRAANGLGDGRVLQSAGFGAAVSNVTIEGIEFDCNRANRAAGMGSTELAFRGVAGGFCEDVHILNCYLHDSPGLGIGFEYSAYVSVRGSRVYNNARDGIGVYRNTYYARIVNNQVSKCADDHIACNSIQATAGSGCAHVVIAGNVIGPEGSGPGNGIRVWGSECVAISGNEIYEPYANGIHVANNGTNRCGDVAITGNTIRDAGINTSGNDGCGITFEIYPQGGVADVFNCVASGNMISNSRWNGIDFRGVTGALIIGVTVANNRLFGSSAAWANGTANGIRVANASVRDLALIGNGMRDFQARAISLDAAADGIDILSNQALNVNQNNAAYVEPYWLGTATNVNFGGNRARDTRGTRKTTFGFNWGTGVNHYAHDNNFQGIVTAMYAGGSKLGTHKEWNNVDPAGALVPGDSGGTSIDLTSLAHIENLGDSTAFTGPIANTSAAALSLPVYVAKFPCRVVAASLAMGITAANGATVAASNTNYWTVGVVRYRANTPAGIASKTTRVDTGEAITRRTDWKFDAVAWPAAGGNGDLAVGDIVAFDWTRTGAAPTTAEQPQNIVHTLRIEPTA